ncbi:type I-C CRISPR-associated protein Cas8c/Csd1 [Enterococcus canis]|uniref:type I-C CRISPR-associated protein Cas8c/Csd1 n=1 Tax=Enterococcus canis TaxID=214095 RepID=UPI0008362BE8|nr:type I-C CRISPR-associated protein Cas8c/Csd1 [Enterococcus canis]
MTWISDLYETYEDNKDQVGKVLIRGQHRFSLLPVGHAYRNIQIEVQVTPDGRFFSARVLSKDEAPTIIPVTEGSAGRANTAAPHPLHDGLKYVAGDYKNFVDMKKKKDDPHALYMTQLQKWSENNYKINAIYIYLQKNSLIHDLVQQGILFLDKEGKLILKWSKELTEEKGFKPEIFDVLVGDQSTAMIRFTIHDPEGTDEEVPLWEDEEVINSAIAEFSIGNEGLDYVTGKMMRITANHTSGLRYAGDMGKLISANDNIGFTYRGRFSKKEEAAGVGYVVSQKAHSALKWLIAKQGIIRDGRVYLVWGKELPEQLTPLAGGNEFAEADELAELFADAVDKTQEEFAELVKATIYGKNNELAIHAKVNIMILDNATKGRLGILYYNSTDQKQYLQRIEKWHEQSAWRHTYFVNKKPNYYYGAPNLYDIAIAAFGEKANDAILNNATTALFTCVVEGKKVPFDLVQKLVHRVSNPQSFEQNWQWRKALTVACSMTNNYYFREKGGCSVSLNKESKERNYLFGRLLAVSHILEKDALNVQGSSNRSTNAERYMSAYSTHPVKTWLIIRKNLQPYINRLSPGKQIFYNRLFDEIMDAFTETTYTDKALDGRYLLGYYSQEFDIYHKSPTKEDE